MNNKYIQRENHYVGEITFNMEKAFYRIIPLLNS